MYTSFSTGILGETIAQKYYERKGLKLLHKNFRLKNYELDLIFIDRGHLLFVEVKTRRFSDYIQKELISNKKLASLKIAIYMYLQQTRHSQLENWELELFSLDIENKKLPKLTVFPLLQGFG